MELSGIQQLGKRYYSDTMMVYEKSFQLLLLLYSKIIERKFVRKGVRNGCSIFCCGISQSLPGIRLWDFFCTRGSPHGVFSACPWVGCLRWWHGFLFIPIFLYCHGALRRWPYGVVILHELAERPPGLALDRGSHPYNHPYLIIHLGELTPIMYHVSKHFFIILCITM